jgi:hypothetical protein
MKFQLTLHLLNLPQNLLQEQQLGPRIYRALFLL